MAADDYEAWLTIQQKREAHAALSLSQQRTAARTIADFCMTRTTRDLPQWNGEWTPAELAEALEPWDGVIFDNTVGERPSQAQVKAAVERLAALLPEEPKCTCGVQHTGGIHSDWCDLERDV